MYQMRSMREGKLCRVSLGNGSEGERKGERMIRRNLLFYIGFMEHDILFPQGRE